MARYCTYCGKPVKEKDKFCTQCGKSILSKIPQTENKTPDVIPEIAHEKLTEKVEEITDEDRSEESIYSKSMKLTDIRIRDLFKGEKLTFLVGAGCSMDPPSCLPAGKSMMKAIINYVCADSEIEKILKLEDLRFEQLVEIVRDNLDEELKIIDYYGQCDKPNMQHFFLAEMIMKGQFVMTTNFDFLIEYALQKTGVRHEDIIPVITRDDFNEFKDPYEHFRKRKKTVYKIHGSTENIITKQTTRESLIATIQAFGSNKEGLNIFQIEPFKRDLFNNITNERSLVVIGYSGSDDFDVVPTLKLLKNIKNFIWINYVPNDGGKEQIYEIEMEGTINNGNWAKVDQILVDIKRMNYAKRVFRVDANTTRMVKELIPSQTDISSDTFSLDAHDWFENNIDIPNRIIKYYIPYKIYNDFDIYDNAMYCLDKILQFAKKSKDKYWEAETLNNIGRIYNNQGNYPKALKRYEEALQIAGQLGYLSGKATYLNNIGSLLNVKGELDEALKYYREALEIHEQLEDVSGRAIDLNNIGEIYRVQGNYPEALKRYEEALQIAEQLGALSKKANFLINIGGIHYNQGSYPEALKRYEEALQINKQLGALRKKAGCLNNIGVIYQSQENYPEALKRFEKALQIAKQLGDLSTKAGSLNNIGGIFLEQGNYPEALKRFEKALQIVEQLGDAMWKATCLNNIGGIHYNQGSYPEALKRFQEALQIAEQLGDFSGKATRLCNIGLIYKAQGNYPEALKRYEEALQIDEQLGDLSGKATDLNEIASIHYNQENYQKAIELLDEALEILVKIGLENSPRAQNIKNGIEFIKSMLS